MSRPRTGGGPNLQVVAVLFALLLPACGNGFENVDHCPDAGCTPCTKDADCQVTVDCCRQTNWCHHNDHGIGTCRVACQERKNPPPVACVASRCRCR